MGAPDGTIRVVMQPKPSLKASLLALALAGGPLALAWLALNLPFVSVEQVESFLAVTRWAVPVLGVLIGVRFRRGRVVFALLVLALADHVLALFPGGGAGGEGERYAFAATAFLLPLDLAWLAAVRERGTLTASGGRRLLAIAVQPALASFLWLSYNPGLAGLLQRPFLPAGLVPALRLPHSAAVAFELALVVTGVAWGRARSFLAAAFLWAVVGSLAATTTAAPGPGMYLTTSGLTLVIALIESTFAMAYRDPLTGLPGRRAFEEALPRLSGRWTIAMVDIDHFKVINDRYGHDVGDQVLRMLAARTADLVGTRAFRFGGEEFALIFPGTSRQAAVERVDEWRRTIGEVDFALRGRNRPRRRPAEPVRQGSATATLHVTISAGVAESGGGLSTPEAVVKSADEALYRAKRDGRNRVGT